MRNIANFRQFVADFTRLVEKNGNDEQAMLDAGAPLLRALIAHDDWLPEECAQPHPTYYQQYLLHCDPLERFSVVSFVWGPGQRTPVHNHTVWGLIGMLRGAETCHRFEPAEAGKPMTISEPERLEPGQIDRVSPTLGDIHQVANASDDCVSIGIHVYGANIGAVERHVFDPATGITKLFVSGYSNLQMPNFWDRSADVRAAAADTER